MTTTTCQLIHIAADTDVDALLSAYLQPGRVERPSITFATLRGYTGNCSYKITCPDKAIRDEIYQANYELHGDLFLHTFADMCGDNVLCFSPGETIADDWDTPTEFIGPTEMIKWLEQNYEVELISGKE